MPTRRPNALTEIKRNLPLREIEYCSLSGAGGAKIMTRILVAIDGSDGANRAVDYAAQRAKTDGADLLIINVVL